LGGRLAGLQGVVECHLLELMPTYWPSQPGFAILCLVTGRANEQAAPNKTAFCLLFSDNYSVVAVTKKRALTELNFIPPSKHLIPNTVFNFIL